MIFKLATVIGLKVYKQSQIRDPDRSYVLTVDNLIKMLAIQMRFRYIHKFLFVKSCRHLSWYLQPAQELSTPDLIVIIYMTHVYVYDLFRCFLRGSAERSLRSYT